MLRVATSTSIFRLFIFLIKFDVVLVGLEMARTTRSYLLGRSADEGLGVQDGVQVREDGAEVGVCLDPGQQVIVSAFLLHHRGSLLGQHADLLVAVLAHGRK